MRSNKLLLLHQLNKFDTFIILLFTIWPPPCSPKGGGVISHPAYVTIYVMPDGLLYILDYIFYIIFITLFISRFSYPSGQWVERYTVGLCLMKSRTRSSVCRAAARSSNTIESLLALRAASQ